jgi:hypothetical protein
MKYYVVSLLAVLLLLAFQTPQALAGGFARGGFASRGFVAGSGPRHFVPRRVIVINPSDARFAHNVIFVPHHRFFIQEPFFCFHHGIGFFDEPAFFDHLHRFDGLAFETMPGVIVHSGSQVFFFGN